MAAPGTVIGWTLDPEERAELLKRYPPLFANLVAHHVTLATDAADRPFPPEVRASLVGHADDGEGVEAMVVAVDGAIERPDGSTFHVTWSLGEGRRARESNDVLKERGWRKLDQPIPLKLTPARM